MFYIGQRVKLVKPFDPKYYGLEGTIADFYCFPKGTMMGDGRPLLYDCNCGVIWDRDIGSERPIACQHTNQLEPIQKPPATAFEASHWDDMPCDRLGKYREKETVT